MTAVTRKGDLTKGNAGPHQWLPTKSIEGSPDVMANGIPVVRVGDAYDIHKFALFPAQSPMPPVSPHDSVSAQGSTTVFANNKAVTRVGDQTSCADIVEIGSPNVFVGG